MDRHFLQLSGSGLTWLPEHGIGYYPVDEAPYDAAYFQKYQMYADTDMGKALTEYRRALVSQYHLGPVLDVGIGCGDFLEAMLEVGPTSRGFDVNPAGRAWLESRGLFHDPYQNGPVDAMTLWDVLEHIHDPEPLLAKCRGWAFVSLPIFRDGEHILQSHHFRKDEHCWYFTREGFICWMARHGFTCVGHSTQESLLGRQDIHTFVFRRTEPAK